MDEQEIIKQSLKILEQANCETGGGHWIMGSCWTLGEMITAGIMAAALGYGIYRITK